MSGSIKKAYEYLSGNMDAHGFSNPDDIVTGEYPDTIFRDEAIWAAVELYAATGDDSYKKAADAIIEGDDIVNYGLGWADVGYYALYDYIKYDGGSAKANELFFNEVDKTVEQIKDNGFGVWVSPTKTFAWGSNMNIANKGMLLLMANKLKPDADYVKYASYQRLPAWKECSRLLLCNRLWYKNSASSTPQTISGIRCSNAGYVSWRSRQ